MNKLFAGLLGQFNEYFKNLGPTKRMSIMAVSAIAVVAGVVILTMVSGEGYVPLLTNIPNDQLSSIIEKLQQKNVPYQLRDSGKTVAVPQELLHSTQMSLMAEIGNARIGQIGLEIFDKQDIGLNSYAQKVNFQRALQGELIRAINTLTAVKQSKVLLALPAKKNFLEDTSPPSASVVVELYPGKNLSAEQIKGIRFLVASGVEGLDPDHVTVVDDRGKLLTRAGEAGTAGSSELMEIKTKVEEDLEGRIEAILSKVVGQARVIARVDATLNNKITQAVEETVDAEKTAIRSQTSEEESMDGSRSNPAGVPGSRANLPGAEDAGQVGFKQGVKKELKTTNFDVPKTVRNIKESAGAVERLSVAVLVDGFTTSAPGANGETETKWNERTPEEIQKFETLVKNAIGFNSARGDSVKIENIKFVAEDFTEADRLLTSLERKKMLHSLLKWSMLGLALALFFFVVVRPFIRWITESFQESVEEMLPRTLEELEDLQSVDNSLPGMSGALPVLQQAIDPDKAEAELLKDRIMTLVEKDSEKAAGAFSLWLVRKDA